MQGFNPYLPKGEGREGGEKTVHSMPPLPAIPGQGLEPGTHPVLDKNP